jgi:hypothetical protein
MTIFKDFSGLENEIAKIKDFQGPVRTVYFLFFLNSHIFPKLKNPDFSRPGFFFSFPRFSVCGNPAVTIFPFNLQCKMDLTSRLTGLDIIWYERFIIINWSRVFTNHKKKGKSQQVSQTFTSL